MRRGGKSKKPALWAFPKTLLILGKSPVYPEFPKPWPIKNMIAAIA
jgi:hypothetical protein